MKPPNKSVEHNRRPAFAFDGEGQVGSAQFAPVPRSAAVAHLNRLAAEYSKDLQEIFG
jgi:hypothetical protein